MTAKRLALNAAAAFAAGLVLGALITIARMPSGVRTADGRWEVFSHESELYARPTEDGDSIRLARGTDADTYAVAVRRAIAVAAHASQALTLALKDFHRPSPHPSQRLPSTQDDPQ